MIELILTTISCYYFIVTGYNTHNFNQLDTSCEQSIIGTLKTHVLRFDNNDDDDDEKGILFRI